MADDQEISDEEVDVEAGDEPTEEDEKDKKTQDIRNPDVVTKYRLAADIANQALDVVVKAAVPGALVVDLCVLGDKYITDHTDTIYRSNKITKGIGFPTCISINNIVGSFSPPKTDDTKLAEGDVVKVDLGVHIDGFVSQVAHTFVVTSTFPVTGRKADVVLAAYTAAECAVRLLKPGTKNTEITAMFEKVAADFKVKTVEGVLSHQVERFVIDAEKVVANNNPEVPLSGDNKIKEVEFEANEAWALDIVMSTGSGKPTVMDNRTTVYKRNVETAYSLKMKAPRAVLSEINQKFPHFPFTTRALEFDEKKLNFGVSNCAKHDLLEAYPVLHEKNGEFVAHVKFTALLLPSGTLKITGGPWDQSKYQSENKVKDEAVLKVLAMPLPKKKKKSKKNKKAKPAAAAGAAPAAAASASAAAPAAAASSNSSA